MFELLVMLCLGDICGQRVLPAPHVQDQSTCEAGAKAHIANWLSKRAAHSVTSHACVEASTLPTAQVVETAPGSYVHLGLLEDVTPENKGDIANTGFIVGDDAVAVIDTGATRVVGEALYAAVRQTTDKPIKYVILTHMHPDHVLGADVFQEAGATVIGSAKLPDALQNRTEAYLTSMDRLISPEVTLGTTVVLPDETVEGTQEIDLGNRMLTLKSHPTAHTNNDLTVTDHAAKTIWMGDLVFLNHTPALDGSIKGWISLLSKLDDPNLVYMIPGHGKAPATFPAGARPNHDYLVELADQTRTAIAEGDSLNDALKRRADDPTGDWLLFELFHLRNATNAYVELEWE